MFGAFLEIEMFKKRLPLWREARFEVKNGKNDGLGPLLGVEVLKKHASKPKWKNTPRSDHFWQASFFYKIEVGFVGASKTMAGVRRLKRICKTCISHGTRSTKDISIRHVRSSRRWFPERGCILEHRIFKFPKVILLDRCSIGWPGLTFW